MKYDEERMRDLLERFAECTAFIYPKGTSNFFYEKEEEETVEVIMKKSFYDEMINEV